jgi:hypothetical protein
MTFFNVKGYRIQVKCCRRQPVPQKEYASSIFTTPQVKVLIPPRELNAQSKILSDFLNEAKTTCRQVPG